MREDLEAKEEAEIDRKEELADNRAAEWAHYWENFRSSPPQLAEDAQAKIPPSAIEAMVPILRRISPVGPYAGNPDQVHRQNAARLLLAAFPEGAVTKDHLMRAVMNTAQLDMLRRCHEDRSALKQKLRAVKAELRTHRDDA